MILVKLGGSVLTNKGARGRPRFLRTSARRLLRELRPVARASGMVLVHGAGSWGHPLALKHGIGRRRLSGSRLMAAVTETRAAVRGLRSLVLQEGLDLGLPLADLPASAVCYADGPDRFLDAGLFRKHVEAGLVPLTGGDVVLDAQAGAQVVSGDELLALLAASLRPRRVVFVTDVDGVATQEGLVARLTPVAARRLLPVVPAGTDATGGMRKKLEAALAIAEAGTQVRIVNGNIPGRAGLACRGAQVAGTVLGPQSGKSGPSLF